MWFDGVDFKTRSESKFVEMYCNTSLVEQWKTTKVDMSGMRALLVASIAAVGSACELKEFKNAAWQKSLPSPLLRLMPCMMHDVSWCLVLTNFITTTLNDGVLCPKRSQKGTLTQWRSARFFNHKSSILPHCEDDYAGSLIGGAIGGIVLALLMIILVSLPLCCGILKQYGKARKPTGWKSSVFSCSFCPHLDFSLYIVYGTFFAWGLVDILIVVSWVTPNCTEGERGKHLKLKQFTYRNFTSLYTTRTTK